MKKLTVLLLALAISLCAVSSAIAANWVEYGRDEDALISYDRGSLQYNGSTIRVWEKIIYRNQNQIKELSKGLKNKVAYAIAYIEYDVNNRTKKMLSLHIYDKNGKSLWSQETRDTPAAIVPGTIGEGLFNTYKEVLGIQ